MLTLARCSHSQPRHEIHICICVLVTKLFFLVLVTKLFFLSRNFSFFSLFFSQFFCHETLISRKRISKISELRSCSYGVQPATVSRNCSFLYIGIIHSPRGSHACAARSLAAGARGVDLIRAHAELSLPAAAAFSHKTAGRAPGWARYIWMTLQLSLRTC